MMTVYQYLFVALFGVLVTLASAADLVTLASATDFFLPERVSAEVVYQDITEIGLQAIITRTSYRLRPSLPGRNTGKHTSLPGCNTTNTAELPGRNTTNTTALPERNTPNTTTLPGGNTTNTTALPERNTTNTTASPGGNTTNTTALPDRNTTNTIEIPGRNTTNTTALPGRNTTNTTALPGGNTTNTTALPGRNTTNTTALPGRNTTNTTALPGRNTTNTTALPGRNTTNSTDSQQANVTTVGSSYTPKFKMCVHDGKDCAGHDIRGINNQNQQKCEQHCLKSTDCSSAIFNKSSKKCWLKNISCSLEEMTNKSAGRLLRKIEADQSCSGPTAPKTECKRTERGPEYNGHLNVAKSGKTCIHWAALTIKRAFLDPVNKFKYFPEKNLKDAVNYCRNPDNTGGHGPWCYVNAAGTWEACDVPFCPGYP